MKMAEMEGDHEIGAGAQAAMAWLIAAVQAEQEALEEYLSDYVFCGDESYHTPTEWERELINDAIQGWLAERTVSSARPATPGTVGAEIEAAIGEEPVSETCRHNNKPVGECPLNNVYCAYPLCALSPSGLGPQDGSAVGSADAPKE